MYKQVIIARKDLNMSPGKLAAQVSHGSIAFLTTMLRETSMPIVKRVFREWGDRTVYPDDNEIVSYDCECVIDKETYEQWVCGAFTKVVLAAKSKNNLLKAKTMAEELDMKEGTDFFCIYDNCLTELEPEEENGRTLTVIGFRPMDSSVINVIGKKFQLYS